jgi:hypothetical protein
VLAVTRNFYINDIDRVPGGETFFPRKMQATNPAQLLDPCTGINISPPLVLGAGAKQRIFPCQVPAPAMSMHTTCHDLFNFLNGHSEYEIATWCGVRYDCRATCNILLIPESSGFTKHGSLVFSVISSAQPRTERGVIIA